MTIERTTPMNDVLPEKIQRGNIWRLSIIQALAGALCYGCQCR